MEYTTTPVRELALQLASGHLLPEDTAESIVDRAEKYAKFLRGATREPGDTQTFTISGGDPAVMKQEAQRRASAPAGLT